MAFQFSLPKDAAQRIARRFYLTAGFILIAVATVAGALAVAGRERMFLAALAIVVGFAAVFAICAALIRRGELHRGVSLALIAMMVAAVGFAVSTGRGLQTLLLAGLGTVVVVAAVVLGRRAAMWFGLSSAVALLGVYVAEAQGWLVETPVPLPLPILLMTQLLLLGIGVFFGWMAMTIVEAAARAANDREHRFRALLGIASDWYWEQDAQFRFTQVSAWRPVPGVLDEAAVIGKTRWELPDNTLSAEEWAAHRQLLLEHRPFRNFIVRARGADANTEFLSISGEPIFDARNQFAGYWGVGRGVTAEIAAQRALEDSERRYRDLFDRTPTPLALHRGGTVLLANRAAANLFGYAQAQEMTGRNLIEHSPPELREIIVERVARLEAMPIGGELPVSDLRVVRTDGSTRHVEATGAHVMLSGGPTILSIYFDITERKNAEAALRRSEQMLSRLFEASPDAIVVSDLVSSRVIMINGRFEAMFGFARDEIVGRRSLDLNLWVDATDRQRLVDVLRRDGLVHGVPVRRRTKDGRVVSVLYSAARMQLDGRECFVGTMRDITAPEQARLRQEAILANASVGIAFTRHRIFEVVNPEFARMFGWMPGALVGQAGSVVWPTAADYAEVGRIAGPLLSAGKPVDFERQMRRADGSSFWCHVRARVVDPRDPAEGGTIWIAEDISEKRAIGEALAAAKEGAEAASRAKSAFLANMSHEIRTPLAGVLGLARLALHSTDQPQRQRDYLRRLLESADALGMIISDILDLSKIEAGKLTIEKVDFELSTTLDSACAAYREVALDKGLAFDLHVDDDVATYVTGDPVRLRQIVGNFVSNALKFTQRGSIEVRVSACGGDRVRLAVRDTGIGVDANARDRLFEPFAQGDESTTRRFGGTGLGLSICRSLATMMGGEVGFSSATGAGSMFWVELPLPAAKAGTRAAAVLKDDEKPLAGLRVLLVEDNPVNMLIAEQLLLHWGAEVTQAADGQQAIEAVERTAGAFDVVLMDVHMPNMGGHEATAALRRRYSKERLPIIALTAAALVSEREQSLAVGMNDFIAKPIEAERMIQVVLRAAAAGGSRLSAS